MSDRIFFLLPRHVWALSVGVVGLVLFLSTTFDAPSRWGIFCGGFVLLSIHPMCAGEAGRGWMAVSMVRHGDGMVSMYRQTENVHLLSMTGGCFLGALDCVGVRRLSGVRAVGRRTHDMYLS